jgi:hypothetical protein
MDNAIEPTVGSWYQDLEDGEIFQVVSSDEDESVLEIQYFDGDLEQVSLDEWRGMDVEVTDAPEDWTGPVDDLERDDLDYSEIRSEGERRGLAEERRRAEVQNSDYGDFGEALSTRRRSDEQREAEVIRGAEREARAETRARGNAE